jgi:Ribbon-helix-helix protein, copG family
MANAKDYQTAADWAEHEMTLKPGSTTALRGDDAAKRGREVLVKALGGRPSIDPDAKPGQHARVRQVRVSTEVDARIEVLAADRHVKASDIIREALAAYLAAAVSQGEKGALRSRRSRTVVPTKAARVRKPAKAVPAVAAKRVSVSAKTAGKRSGVAAKRPAENA